MNELDIQVKKKGNTVLFIDGISLFLFKVDRSWMEHFEDGTKREMLT